MDGQGEYISFRTRFKGSCKILKTDGPRGHTASIDAIVYGAKKQIAILKACGCQQVIVLIDFETRTNDYLEFLKQLQEKFNRVFIECPVYIAMPNIMIENWYLADIVHLSNMKVFLRNNLRQKNYEGTHGKNELKRCFAPGLSYIETTHGPQLFALLRFDTARGNSQSFDAFLTLIEHISCS